MNSRKVQDSYKNDCDIFLESNNACVILKVLSDSNEFKKHFVDSVKEVAFEKGHCFRTVMNRLSSEADLNLNWTCSIVPCRYNSYSLEKSIYKIDLIRLMRANKCPDTAALFSTTKGSFTPQELGIIKTENQFEIRIDTMILYGK